MAPRTRARTARGSSVASRISTQFGELDTTPTSRHLQSPVETTARQKFSQRPQADQAGNQDDFGNGGLEDDEFSQAAEAIDATQRGQTSHSCAWSKGGSQTRRSSPVNDGETRQDIWEFDDDIRMSQFSSRAPDADALPDTVPLPRPGLTPDMSPRTIPDNQAAQQVDLSETASTARRSSPYKSDQVQALWDLDSEGDGQNATEPTSEVQCSENTQPRVPLDDIYDATPPRLSHRGSANGTETQPVVPHTESPANTSSESAGQASQQDKRMSDERKKNDRNVEDSAMQPGKQDIKVPTPPNENKSSPVEEKKTRKRKQRAKTPLEFDDQVQVVGKKQKTATRPTEDSMSRKAAATKPPAKKQTVAKAKKGSTAKKSAGRPKKKGKTLAPGKETNDKSPDTENRDKVYSETTSATNRSKKLSGTVDIQIVPEPKADPSVSQEADDAIHIPSSPASSVSSPAPMDVQEEPPIAVKPAEHAPSPTVEEARATNTLPNDLETSNKKPNVESRTTRSKTVKAPQKRSPLAHLDPNVAPKLRVQAHELKHRHHVLQESAKREDVKVKYPVKLPLVRTISVSERGSPVRIDRSQPARDEPDDSSSSLESIPISFNENEQESSTHDSSSIIHGAMGRNWRARERRHFPGKPRRLIDFVADSEPYYARDPDGLNMGTSTTINEKFSPGHHIRDDYVSNRGTYTKLLEPDSGIFDEAPEDEFGIYQQLHAVTDVCKYWNVPW